MQISKKTKIICIITIIIIVIITYQLITKEEYIEDSFDIQADQEIQENQETSNNQIKGNINKIVIYITGEVNKEGIYEIEEGSRIADAIEIAGGITENANIKIINLAYMIEDGMKIHIPNKNENLNLVVDNTENYITRENSILEELDKTRNGEKNKININKANQTELEQIPGIGSVTALKIIEYRKENGKFKNIEDIKNVNGIGENKFAKMKKYIEI